MFAEIKEKSLLLQSYLAIYLEWNILLDPVILLDSMLLANLALHGPLPSGLQTGMDMERLSIGPVLSFQSLIALILIAMYDCNLCFVLKITSWFNPFLEVPVLDRLSTELAPAGLVLGYKVKKRVRPRFPQRNGSYQHPLFGDSSK